MSNAFELSAQIRTDTGKGASRRLRRDGKNVPAIVYGGDQPVQQLTLQANQIRKSLENEAFYSHILTLDVEGVKQQVVLRDLQRHPVRTEVIHLDFFRVSDKEALVMTVPIHFLNADKAPGVKDGGIVSHQTTELEIKCLPKDLPEFLSIDLGQLKLDESLHISDIKLPEGVSLSHVLEEDHDFPVASIHKPHMAAVEDTAPVAAPVPSEKGSDEVPPAPENKK